LQANKNVPLLEQCVKAKPEQKRSPFAPIYLLTDQNKIKSVTPTPSTVKKGMSTNNIREALKWHMCTVLKLQ